MCREFLHRFSHQRAAVVLKHSFFRIGTARIRIENVFVKFRCVLQWPVCMQPGIASIPHNFHEPSTRIAAAEAGKESESSQVCFLGDVLCEAVAELQKAAQLSGGSPTVMANLARAYVASGKRGEAIKLLSGLKKRSNASYSHGSEIAVIYAALGDTDQVMNSLEKGFEERFNPGVLLRPGFDPLRSDPRFQELVRHVGLNR
jgi:hypothetical protein